MERLLDVKDLTTVFEGDAGQLISVDHASFHVNGGEVVCLVGESGCGKSVTSLSVMGLLPRSGHVMDGSVLFDGKELLGLSEQEMDELRGNRISMIFQDPLTSLNPVFTVGSQITESLRIHLHLSKQEANARAERFLERVGMPDPARAMKKYPHELSGGQRQRVMIAMALCCEPALLIADEPTTALDVTIQAQIMQLLRGLQQETGMALILITHDIGVVAAMADRVLVMYAGQIVEEAPVRILFHRPAHPYTKALLAAIPGVRDGADRTLFSIPGIVPEHYDRMTGCRFAPRCKYRTEACMQPQELQPTGEGTVRAAGESKSVYETGRSGQAHPDDPEEPADLVQGEAAVHLVRCCMEGHLNSTQALAGERMK